MTIEHAIVRARPKPWGSLDLRPWSQTSTGDGPIGELWFERPGLAAPKTALLLKMLFTTEPLSIQVHPDDAFAHSIGLANGKTEAWYIVSAVPGAQVAVGLDYPRSAAELRTAVTDGSIADIVHWQPVHPGDVIFIPAGTIHAIGAGIVLVEIQQHSDATFRLFDYGRGPPTAHRQCRRGGHGRPSQNPIAFRTSERRANRPHRQFLFCAGAN
ncbi:mannose-6-phosphate isomerase class I [Bradyrhizobium sp. LB7.2]